MKVKIKICGMRDETNISAVAALSPDYMGFIHYPPSPRYVGDAFRVPPGFPAGIEKVGVFVNEGTKTIVQTLQQNHIMSVQLHGDEPPRQCADLRSMGFNVIKVFSVGEGFDFARTRDYEDDVNYFLFDTKGKLYGGNAQQFDWEVLNDYDQRVPFFLSGGLNDDNLKSISRLEGMNLHAVDLNSGVEMSAGVKNVDMLRDLMNRLNQL